MQHNLSYWSQQPCPTFRAILWNTIRTRVQIYYSSANATHDIGTLLYRDDHWVELRKDDGWHLLIPIVAIRIIKLLDKAAPNADAQILLRPAESAPHKQITGEK